MSFHPKDWDNISHQVDQFQQARDQNRYFVAVKAKGPTGTLTQVRCLSSIFLIAGIERFFVWLTKPKGTELLYGRASEDGLARTLLTSIGRSIIRSSQPSSDTDYPAFMKLHGIKTVKQIETMEKKIGDICAKHAALAKPLEAVHVDKPISMNKEREILAHVESSLVSLKEQITAVLSQPEDMSQSKNMIALLQQYLGDTQWIEVLEPEAFSELEKSLQQVMDKLVRILEQEASRSKNFDRTGLQLFQEVQREFHKLRSTLSKSVGEASSKSWAAERLEKHCLKALNEAASSHFETTVSHLKTFIESKKKEKESLDQELSKRGESLSQLEGSAKAHRTFVVDTMRVFEENLNICSSPAFNSIPDDVRGHLSAIQAKFQAYRQALLASDELIFDTFMTSDWLNAFAKDIATCTRAFETEPLHRQENHVLSDLATQEKERESVKKLLEQAYADVDATQAKIEGHDRFQLDFAGIEKLIRGFGKYVVESMDGNSRATLKDLLAKMQEPSLTAGDLLSLLKKNITFFSEHGFRSSMQPIFIKLRLAIETSKEHQSARKAFEELSTMMQQKGLSDEAYVAGIEALQEKYQHPFFLQAFLAQKTLAAGLDMLPDYDKSTADDAGSVDRVLETALDLAKKGVGRVSPQILDMEQDLIQLFNLRKALEVIDSQLPPQLRRKEKDYDRWEGMSKVLAGLDPSIRMIVDSSLEQIRSMDPKGEIRAKLQTREAHKESVAQLKISLSKQQAHAKELKRKFDQIYQNIEQLTIAHRALMADRESKLKLLHSLYESLDLAKSHSVTMTELHQQIGQSKLEISRLQNQQKRLEKELILGHETLAMISEAQTVEAFTRHLEQLPNT